MKNPEAALNQKERRAVFSLAGIFGLRLLGLFLVLPVFSVYAHGLRERWCRHLRHMNGGIHVGADTLMSIFLCLGDYLLDFLRSQ